MIKFLISLVMIAPLVIFSQADKIIRKKGELIILGEFNHVKEPVNYIYMICLDGSNGGYDSVPVINNNYVFRIETKATTLVTLYAKNPLDPDHFSNKYMLTIVVEPATVLISSTDSFSNAKISGSRAYQEYQLLEHRCAPYAKCLGTLVRELLKNQDAGNKEGVEKLNKEIHAIRKQRDINVYYKYSQTTPSSILMNYAINEYINSFDDNTSPGDVKKVAFIYAKLTKSDQDSYFGKRIKKKIDSYKISVGMLAPDIDHTDIYGNRVSLASFKDKFVLLDFWASWCAPCRRDFPHIKELYKEYKKNGFEIISISKDTDTAACLKAIKQDGIDKWINTIIDQQIMKSYFVSAIPLKVLIDPKGLIIGIWREGGEESFSSLKNLIAINIKKAGSAKDQK